MKRQAKKLFKCVDGPYKGRTLRLAADGTTFVFTTSGQTGRYIRGKWHAQVS